MSAASAAALIQCSSNFRYGGQDAFSVALKTHAYFLWPNFKFMLYSVTCYMKMLC